ncbi:MAG: 50S ribosomal protein L4 [Defluviitaleaceae bacterium]|nr:50S ribosomal protein L4 [Defluviitaleaceae bacterium]
MATVDVYNMSGEKVGDAELNDAIFGVPMNEPIVHAAVVQYLANQRQGTKATKTRAQVRGSTRKPYRQKGTGRARHGSTRSPIWTGGGMTFAFQPRDHSFKLNKKVKRQALKCALSSRALEDKLVVVDELTLDEIKTKKMRQTLDNLKLNKALVVLDGSMATDARNVILSARNIPDVKTASVGTINVYDILKFDTFVVTKQALEKIQEVYA